MNGLFLRSSAGALSAFSVLVVLFGCGGPKFGFDPSPAPSWIKAKPSDVSARSIEAIGSAPATTLKQRDLDLATRDAKNRVAQIFESQIVSRSSDWMLAVEGGKESTERTALSQSVDVRSNVKVEDVSVVGSYRDEATKMQYVKIAVDRTAWVTRLRGRLADGVGQVERRLQAATDALASRRPLLAYKEIAAGFAEGRRIEPDIVVLDLLNKELGVRAKLLDLKTQMDSLKKKLTSEYRIAVSVDCKDSQFSKRLAGNVEQFLNGYGFSVGKGRGKMAKVTATVTQRFVKTEQVADRTEFIHAGEGSLRVFDADGGEVAELSVKIEAGRYEERDVDKKKAGNKALELAADTLASKFRSSFRNAFSAKE